MGSLSVYIMYKIIIIYIIVYIYVYLYIRYIPAMDALDMRFP